MVISGWIIRNEAKHSMNENLVISNEHLVTTVPEWLSELQIKRIKRIKCIKRKQ